MEKCPTELVTKSMQIKHAMRHGHFPTRMVKTGNPK